MALKIVSSHAASIVAQIIKDGVRARGREARLKRKRHSSSASLTSGSTNVPVIFLEGQSGTAQSNRTQRNVEHFRKNHHRLLLGNWNIFTLTGKEFELVNKTRKCHPDIVGFSAETLCQPITLFHVSFSVSI